MTVIVKSKDELVVPRSVRRQAGIKSEASKGPYYGPFKTADEAIAFLRKSIRNRKAAKRKIT